MISSHAADALYISSSFEKANVLRVSRLLRFAWLDVSFRYMLCFFPLIPILHLSMIAPGVGDCLSIPLEVFENTSLKTLPLPGKTKCRFRRNKSIYSSLSSKRLCHMVFKMILRFLSTQDWRFFFTLCPTIPIRFST